MGFANYELPNLQLCLYSIGDWQIAPVDYVFLR